KAMQGGQGLLDLIDRDPVEGDKEFGSNAEKKQKTIAELKAALMEVNAKLPPDKIVVGRKIYTKEGAVLTDIDLETSEIVCQVKETDWSTLSELNPEKERQLLRTKRYNEIGAFDKDGKAIPAPNKKLVVRFMGAA